MIVIKTTSLKHIILYSILTLAILSLTIFNYLQTNNLNSKDANLTSVTTEFVKLLHTRAEDLFYPYSPWNWGSLSGIDVNNTVEGPCDDMPNLHNEIKISEAKLKSRTEEQTETWREEQRQYAEDGETLKGYFSLHNYNHSVDDILTPKMKLKLESEKEIIEYNDALYVSYGPQEACCPGTWISSEFIPKTISAEKIDYIVRSKYADTLEEWIKYDETNEIDETHVKNEEKDFVLIKSDGRWLIDKFETSKYYDPV